MGQEVKANSRLRPDPRQEAGSGSDASCLGEYSGQVSRAVQQDEGIYKKEMRGISFHRGVELEFRGE